MRRIIAIGAVAFAVTVVVLVFFSQFSPGITKVDSPFSESKGTVPSDSLVLVRRVDPAQNLTGCRVLFWWNAQYFKENKQLVIPVMGIGRVTNENATVVSVADESDDSQAPRRTRLVERANVTGEFVALLNLP